MKTIFVVDDSDVNLITAEKALTGHYDVFTLPSAEAMFTFLNDIRPDLILLDIKMPDIDGFEALRRLRANPTYANIPVMFITATNDPATESYGFELGAIDFIIKPFSSQVLLSRIKTHLDVEGLIQDRTSQLNSHAERLQLMKKSIVTLMANMVENRDTLTGKHVERTSIYVKVLIEAMLERGIYTDEMQKWNIDITSASSVLHDVGIAASLYKESEGSLEDLVHSVRLHDIGKIVISDLILNKNGKLTDEEFNLMKTHTIEGEKIIDSIIAETGNEFFLDNAKLFAGYHHEKWDGTGYPRALKGADIPLQGRIMAIADVYDALVSTRPYKEAFSHEKSMQIIKENAGTQFDPQIVEVFLEIHEKFAEIMRNTAD